MTIKRIVTTIAGILLAASIVCAQEQNIAGSGRSAITVTAAATADRVRFTAPSSVVQMRLEIYNANGEKLFDNEIRGGNVIDWLLQDGQAQRLSDGSYLCVVTAKTLSGRISQKLGSVALANAAASIQPADSAQLTSRQSQAVGPLEENASFTILKEGASQTTTVIAHDGTDGQITRGRGALSFRIGDFFSGKDTEQMRLTEDGNLGIGTSDPKLKLDVAGMIGARDGFMFSDGSTLSVNRKGVLTHTTSNGQVVPSASGTGTQNQLAKWADNSGTLGNSAIVDVNGDIGIGTTSPQSGLDYHSGSAAFFTRDFPTNPGNAVSALQVGLSNVGSRNAGVGPSFLFFGENSHGVKSFLGRVSGVWENPTAGIEAGAIFFQVRANGSDVNALTERMRITASGNVGIGTTAPLAKLDVAGDINTMTQYNIGGTRVLRTDGTSTLVGELAGEDYSGIESSFFGYSAGQNNTGSYNSFFGFAAGRDTNGFGNAFFGDSAGRTNTGDNNSFFGSSAGFQNNQGTQNSFFGYYAGQNNISGSNNVFIGHHAGNSNTSGSYNTMIGDGADGNDTLTHATAIGAGSVVHTSNTIVLGRSLTDNVIASNRMQVRSIPLLSSVASVCFNNAGDLLQCGASSLRWKTNVQSYRSGLDVIRRLRPISFNWKEDGRPDIGLGAEDVAKVAPSFAYTNNKGEVEGVKYERLNILLINAVKEQQAQIQQQQSQINRQQEQTKQQQEQLRALRNVVCRSHPRAKACKN